MHYKGRLKTLENCEKITNNSKNEKRKINFLLVSKHCTIWSKKQRWIFLKGVGGGVWITLTRNSPYYTYNLSVFYNLSKKDDINENLNERLE